MKIEKGIPFRARAKHNELNKVLAEMKVGESIIIKKENANVARQIATRFAKKTAIRKISETESRLWIIG